jgi:hypothetical protein
MLGKQDHKPLVYFLNRYVELLLLLTAKVYLILHKYYVITIFSPYQLL